MSYVILIGHSAFSLLVIIILIIWPSYNESLVKLGQVLLDFDVLDGRDQELIYSSNWDGLFSKSLKALFKSSKSQYSDSYNAPLRKEPFGT